MLSLLLECACSTLCLCTETGVCDAPMALTSTMQNVADGDATKGLVRRELESPQPPHPTPASSSLVAYARREWPRRAGSNRRSFTEFTGQARQADVDLRVLQLMVPTQELSSVMMDAVQRCVVAQLYWSSAVCVDAVALVDLAASFILLPSSIEVIVDGCGIITGAAYVRMRRAADVWRLIERGRCEPYQITRMVRAQTPRTTHRLSHELYSVSSADGV